MNLAVGRNPTNNPAQWFSDVFSRIYCCRAGASGAALGGNWGLLSWAEWAPTSFNQPWFHLTYTLGFTEILFEEFSAYQVCETFSISSFIGKANKVQGKAQSVHMTIWWQNSVWNHTLLKGEQGA